MSGFGGGFSTGPSSSGGGGFMSGFGNYMDILGPLLGSMGGGQQQVQPPPPVGLLGPIPQVGNDSFTGGFTPPVRDPDAGTLSEAIDLPASEKLPKKTVSDRAGEFFGNIDNTIQSPSKMIGIGLLNQQDPNLALAALLASGLLGGNDAA